jgi:CRP-like cAMP-binding protein
VSIPKKQLIYAQGAACDAVFYIQKGKVRPTVVSKNGKEATDGHIESVRFPGEGGLAGQPLRMGAATAMTDSELIRIEKTAMDGSAPPRTCLVRPLYGIFVGPEHPIRGGLGGPTI